MTSHKPKYNTIALVACVIFALLLIYFARGLNPIGMNRRMNERPGAMEQRIEQMENQLQEKSQ